jgi:ABC-type molybdate transport system ATPase subunit
VPQPLRNQAALALLGITLAACSNQAKREAAILMAAVDGFRRADGASKAALAAKVARVACTDEKVCAAKRACVEAIDPTARALALKEEVATSVSDIERKRVAPESPEARALPAKLDEAERLLNEGRLKMSACDRGLAELQLQHGI